jgi:hypothetical protein
MSLSFRAQLLAAVGLVTLCVLSRLFTPLLGISCVAGVALFAGWLIRDRAVALAVPLLSMAVSDMFLERYEVAFMALVYAASAIPVLLRPFLGKGISVFRIAACTVIGGILYELIVDFGTWRFYETYPHTTSGLLLCYLAGVPFFLRKLVGDAACTFLLFGACAVAIRLRSIAPEQAVIAPQATESWNAAHFNGSASPAEIHAVEEPGKIRS